MPKKVVTLNDFSGGLNNTSDPRDLTGKQLNVCTNYDPSSPGKIVSTTNGHTVFLDGGPNGSVNCPEFNPTVGSGAFVFQADYRMDNVTALGASGTNATPGHCEFIVAQNGNKINILEIFTSIVNNVSTTVYTWRANVFTGFILGDAAASTSVPVRFYTAEGDLFICSNRDDITGYPTGQANGSPEEWPVSLQFIQRKHFGHSLAMWKYSAAGYYPAPRTAEFIIDNTEWSKFGVDLHNSSINAVDIPPQVSSDNDFLIWALAFNTEEDSGTWNNDIDTGKVWELGSSFVYKNHAESKITAIGVTDAEGFDQFDSHTNKSVKVAALIQTYESVHIVEIHGAKLYVREKGTGTWFNLAEVDYDKGLKGDGEDSFTEMDLLHGFSDQSYFTATGFVNAYKAITGWIISPPVLVTYELANGFKDEMLTVDGGDRFFYSSAVVANSRAYIANVFSVDGGTLGDRILKSPVFKYDLFHKDDYIDVAPNDGDRIIALSTYADRLLVFKQKSLFILNISKELEFLESEHKYAGVRMEGAISKTPFGVAWVNGNGCWLYDGESVNALQLGKISDSEWKDNVGTEDTLNSKNNAITGYDELNQQLIVIWDSYFHFVSTRDAYIYSFNTGGWHQAKNIITHSSTMSNFVNLSSYRLAFIGSEADKEGIIKEWTAPTANAANSELRTADLHFGNYLSIKNILKITIVYKTGTALTIYGRANQADSFTSIGSLSTIDNTFTIDSFDVSSTAGFQGINTFQLALSANASSTLEIEDISITFRDLGVH